MFSRRFNENIRPVESTVNGALFYSAIFEKPGPFGDCLLCTTQKPAGSCKITKMHHSISFSSPSHVLHSRFIPVGGQNHFLICATLHNFPLHCVGGAGCASSDTNWTKRGPPSDTNLQRRLFCQSPDESSANILLPEAASAGEDPYSYSYRSA